MSNNFEKVKSCSNKLGHAQFKFWHQLQPLPKSSKSKCVSSVSTPFRVLYIIKSQKQVQWA